MSQVSPSKSEKDWICTLCELRNVPSLTNCTRCGTSKYAWQCDNCSYVNVSSTHCTVCSEPNDLSVEKPEPNDKDIIDNNE